MTKEETEIEKPTSVGRNVITLRALPTLKQELSSEAYGLGVTLSEHCESILSNRHTENPELLILREKIVQQKGEIEKLTGSLALKPNSGDDILSDTRLNFLFEKLKGKNDTVTNAYGENFSITYNSPADVLKAIIYSSHLNS